MKTGYRTLLVVIAVLAALVSLLAYFLGQNSTTVDDIALAAGIADLTANVAIVAAVGALVLTGMAELLSSLKFEVRQQQHHD